MIDVKKEYVEDPEMLKSWNYNEPVLAISTPYSHSVIPMSHICYREIKRIVNDAKSKVQRIEEADKNP